MLQKKRRLARRTAAVLSAVGALLLLALLRGYSNVGSVVVYEVAGADSLPLTLHCNEGRLGNQLCTYATLLGLSVLNRRPWAAHHCNVRRLRPHFPQLSPPQTVLPWLFVKRGEHRVGSFFKPEDARIDPGVNYIGGYLYPCSYTFFDHVRALLKKEFAFQPHVQRHADAVLRKSNVHRHPNATYVGVHVRRGDYKTRWLDVFEGVPVDMHYFESAFRYFRTKYGRRAVFVAVSDDRLWCIENLAPLGAYVAEESPDAVHDLAILASCNHTVMTYGTFGFWGAYLAGGETVYFDKFLKPGTDFTRERFVFEKMYPPSWKGIASTNRSVWNAEDATVT